MNSTVACEESLAREYQRLFHETPILGGSNAPPIMFQEISGGRIGSVMTEVDPGRFLQLIFFVDGLDGFGANGGLSGANSDPGALSSAVTGLLRQAAAEVKNRTGFRDGIALVVGCGYGRGLYFAVEEAPPEHWRLESVAAHDLVTLSWLSEFDRLSLWRLLDSREAIGREGVKLVNVNGLLNLVAWSRQLGGHIVPHSQLPDSFGDHAAERLLMIPQNALRGLRHEVIQAWDPRRMLDSAGRWVMVRKLHHSPFEEDNATPLYGSVEDLHNARLRGAYVTAERPWWIEITAPEDTPRSAVFEHWMMLCTWLARAAPVLNEAYTALPAGPISFQVKFAEIVGSTFGTVIPKSADELRSLSHVTAEAGRAEIVIDIACGFDDGLMQPENVAERTLVEALVDGAARVGGELGDARKRHDLVRRICPNSHARWMHRFEARSFRDLIQPEISGKPVLIDLLDQAAARIGLGWRVRSRDDGPEILGVLECTSYLNDVIRIVLDDFCAALRRLNRRSFVRAALYNHEVASYDRDVWNRSTQANLGLHDDQEAAVRIIQEHQSRLNACFIASRILVEAAICECPLDGGGPVGRLDLSRAMSQALLAHHLGGWSDAVYWGAMEPRVRITPLGDVHMNQSFLDRVYEPFGRAGAEAQVRYAVDSYAKLYSALKMQPRVADVFEPRFLDAWQAEFGASLDGVLAFVEALEDIGQNPPRAVFDLQRSFLIETLAAKAGISAASAGLTLDRLALVPRAEWRGVTSDFKDKDWFPWRFRRRLSVLRRPLIQIDSTNDPIVLCAPGVLREGVPAMVMWFHGGEIPSSQARSREMCQWIGHANNVQRAEFNSITAARMRDLGWQVDQGVRLTKIVGRRLERDYGDIDVLAWRAASGRVLAMECKDLQFHKTIGEVAEQLADFRGEIGSDGKPDHLRRHLNRLEVLAAHHAAVSKALNLASPIQIEGHVVFRNPVPMKFAWDHLSSRVRLSLFDELDRL
jgi:hypothetical protein